MHGIATVTRPFVLVVCLSVRDVDVPNLYWVSLNVIPWIISLGPSSETQHRRSSPRGILPKFGWNRGVVLVLSRKPTVSLKRGKIGPRLLFMKFPLYFWPTEQLFFMRPETLCFWLFVSLSVWMCIPNFQHWCILSQGWVLQVLRSNGRISRSYMHSIGTKINDRGWPWTAVMHSTAQNVRLSELTMKISSKIDPHCPQRRYSSMTLVSHSVSFMWIFTWIPWREGH